MSRTKYQRQVCRASKGIVLKVFTCPKLQEQVLAYSNISKTSVLLVCKEIRVKKDAACYIPERRNYLERILQH